MYPTCGDMGPRGSGTSNDSRVLLVANNLGAIIRPSYVCIRVTILDLRQLTSSHCDVFEVSQAVPIGICRGDLHLTSRVLRIEARKHLGVPFLHSNSRN